MGYRGVMGHWMACKWSSVHCTLSLSLVVDDCCSLSLSFLLNGSKVNTLAGYKYRLKHGFECHTGYNGTVATSARGPQARGRKPQRCHYSPYGARSHALTYL